MENNDKQRYKDIGKRIQKARDEAGLTQEQLAKLVGYQTATAISFIEAGERKLKVNELEKIAGVLHCDIQYLLTGNTDKSVTVRMALRAEHKDLGQDEIEQIESFINFVRSGQHGRRDANKQ